MNLPIYHAALNLNGIGALRSDLNWTTLALDNQYQKILVKSDLNPNLIDLLTQLGLDILWIECFYLDPRKLMQGYFPDYFHTDSGGGDYVKLNWQYGGGGSEMSWAIPKNGRVNPMQTTSVGTKYRSYHSSELRIVDRCTVGFPSIVQVGVAHNVHNFLEPRLCVCVSPGLDGQPLSMTRALEIFKDYRIQ